MWTERVFLEGADTLPILRDRSPVPPILGTYICQLGMTQSDQISHGNQTQ